MMDLMDMGLHKKLKITAYKDASFSTPKSGAVFTAMLNPESISEEYTVEYNDEQAVGSPDSCIKYKKTPPGSIKFDLILDGSGVVDLKRNKIGAELEALKSVVYDYNGSSHQPSFVKVELSESSAYTCRLSSLAVNITRFRLNGSYLRAKVSLSFKSVALESKSKGNQSPDMTHQKTVRAGDQLAALSRQVYDDENHMLALAEFNKLNSLLYLQPGSQILFPPLSNQ